MISKAKLTAETANNAKANIIPHCVLFAEWLRINFNNSPEEIDNYWEDVKYTIDNYRILNYTTEELYVWWTKHN